MSSIPNFDEGYSMLLNYDISFRSGISFGTANFAETMYQVVAFGSARQRFEIGEEIRKILLNEVFSSTSAIAKWPLYNLSWIGAKSQWLENSNGLLAIGLLPKVLKQRMKSCNPHR